MKSGILATAALLGSTAMGLAGGLDRSGQPIGIIFESGNYAEFSFGRTTPELSGTDLVSGAGTGNIGLSFNTIGAGLKMDINEQLSAALIVDQPFGADISYPVSPASPLLGGTEAFASTSSITGVLRYKFSDRMSVHGGLRVQKAEGQITLNGLAYGGPPPGGLTGYSVDLESDTGVGYVIGAAYEIPDIAMRVSLTYNSAITHKFDTRENIAPGAVTTTETDTPESINLDFQTGINPKTLVYGGIRYAKWSDFKIRPTVSGTDLVDLDDSTSYSLGIARRLNDNWSASLTLGYEKAGGSDLLSPLAPSNGMRSIAAGLQYSDGKMRISGGVRYTKVGDGFAETADTPRARFEDNDAVSIGVKVGWSF